MRTEVYLIPRNQIIPAWGDNIICYYDYYRLQWPHLVSVILSSPCFLAADFIDILFSLISS